MTAIRHGIVFAVTAALFGLFMFAKGGHELNLILADVGVVLIAASLLIGPLMRLWPRVFKKVVPYRREVGIWAGVTSLAHVVLLASDKLGWNPLRWFMTASASGYSLTLTAEGLGNLIGTVAACYLLVLTLTSNNASQKLLGVGPWKFLQQGTYVAFVLVALHSVIFLYGGHHAGEQRMAASAVGAPAATAEGRPARTKPGMPADGSTAAVRPEGKDGGKSGVFRWVFWGATLAVAGLQGAGFAATVWKKKTVSRMGGEAAGTP